MPWRGGLASGRAGWAKSCAASLARSVVQLVDPHERIAVEGTIVSDPKGKAVSDPAFTAFLLVNQVMRR